MLADDFLTNNFLSDDKRRPVTIIGTNIGRAMASNATRGHIWEQFSSETYKALPPVGTLQGLFNPRDPAHPIEFTLPAGGPRLLPDAVAHQRLGDGAVPAQQLGRHLHQGSVRRGAGCPPSPTAMEKMLWPEKRLGSAVDSGHDDGQHGRNPGNDAECSACRSARRLTTSPASIRPSWRGSSPRCRPSTSPSG